MEMIAVAILALLAITYAGYPIAVIALAALRRPTPTRAAAIGATSIIICAYNEAGTIGPKLRSVIAASITTPHEIIIADDGSTDATASVVEDVIAAHPGAPIRLFRLPRGGKAAALDHAVAAATGDILVFTDADPLFDAQTMPALIAPFADPRIGAVAGSVETIGDDGRHRAGDSLFRRYESALRDAEQTLFGCISADGGLFAIRGALMPAIPADVTDDFWISTAAVAAGRRIAFAPGARVWERSIGRDASQFRRRIRITVRGLTGLWRRRALLNPARTGGYAVGLFFHKALRRFAPLTLPALWLLSLALAGEGPVWMLLAVGIGALAAAGLLVALVPMRLPRIVALPYFILLHLAGLGAGAILFLAGRRYRMWTPAKDGA